MHADEFDIFPLSRAELFSGSTAHRGWRAGGCNVVGDNLFPLGGTPNGMGQHYWRTSVYGTVQDNFPYFLLYDQYDRLNQFGIAIATPMRVRRQSN